ncbi:hypothetical protein MmTuc01_0158 [Methanosarcina mazei Tuc01]|uniref:Uncharacterized protein n=1 Tax=Methanosarcina mazei Tuc01 TaxID=1236903 RepID=M1Q639_METMZ|nr:hypothetical protein MmTuc01_0158 [Methanosarcina mazei Tuc01]
MCTIDEALREKTVTCMHVVISCMRNRWVGADAITCTCIEH